MEGATANTILFVGKPGSGKGTQAEMLSKKGGWQIISSGNQFRELRNGEGPLSDRIREIYDRGQLVPDWFPDYLFGKAVLNISATEGIILEGFGRTRPQAELMCRMLPWLGRTFVVINLAVSDEEALARQAKRSEVDKRPDSDSVEKLKARLAEYSANTEPALSLFREQGVCVDINGEPDVDTIHQDILLKLNLK
jgi:adenylate kinase